MNEAAIAAVAAALNKIGNEIEIMLSEDAAVVILADLEANGWTLTASESPNE